MHGVTIPEPDVIVGTLDGPTSVLVIGAHPDDADLNCGGLLLLEHERDRQTAILDLTLGEAGSRGTVEDRRQESIAAAEILGVGTRVRLDLGDGRLAPTLEGSLAIARVIRHLRPTVVVAPYPEDKHPDHAAAGKLVESALYHGKMRSFDLGPAIWSPKGVLLYNQHVYRTPDLVIDVTPVFEGKMEAIRAFKTQFATPLTDIDKDYIPLGTPDYPWFAETRMRQYGGHIRVKYGEGYLLSEPLRAVDPVGLFD